MLYDEMPVALPWYDNIAKQDRFKPNASQDVPWPQLSPKDGLLPFQVRKPAMGERPIHFYIRCCADGSEIVDMDGIISSLEYGTNEGYDYITWNEEDNILLSGAGVDIQPGDYYYEMQFRDKTYVSEVVRVPQDRFVWNDPTTCNYPILTWDNAGADLRPMKYSGATFVNKMILDTFIQASQPVIDLEIVKDGVNEPIATFQKVSIVYQMICAMPDFMKVALCVMEIHANINLVTDRGLRSGPLKNIVITGSVEEDGAHTVVTIAFEQTVIISRTSCADNMAAEDCSIVIPAPPLYSTWNLPDLSLFVKSSSFPFGYYGEVWAYKNSVSAYIRVADYVSALNLRMGYVFPMPGGTHMADYAGVYLVVRTFTCEDLVHSPVRVPVATF